MGSRLNECMYFNSSANKNVEGGGKRSYIMQPYVIFFNCLTCQVGRRHLEMKREIKVEDMLDVKRSNDLLNFCTLWKLHTKTAFIAGLMWQQGFSFFFSSFFYLLKFEKLPCKHDPFRQAQVLWHVPWRIPCYFQYLSHALPSYIHCMRGANFLETPFFLPPPFTFVQSTD